MGCRRKIFKSQLWLLTVVLECRRAVMEVTGWL